MPEIAKFFRGKTCPWMFRHDSSAATPAFGRLARQAVAVYFTAATTARGHPENLFIAERPQLWVLARHCLDAGTMMFPGVFSDRERANEARAFIPRVPIVTSLAKKGGPRSRKQEYMIRRGIRSRLATKRAATSMPARSATLSAGVARQRGALRGLVFTVDTTVMVHCAPLGAARTM